ncbi:MAG: hypothetical protein HC880_18700 [Bacteroidia bacterium]|nr:hypothetical protein [Bacteroidia bacterium]
MEQAVQQAADQLKEQIWQEPIIATQALIQFAQKYAWHRNLKQMAFLLRFEYLHCHTDEERSSALVNMIELVDDIVQSYRNQTHEAEMEQLQARQARITAYYKRCFNPPNDVIFKGEDLGKTFRRGGFSLQNVDLELRLGEITGVVGENANGKNYPLSHPGR